ncbi:MAG: serine/threonine protein kinase [Chloroflexi bacterium]|nr:serine/threonine protein kinase [Chloroflexota bacterium]
MPEQMIGRYVIKAELGRGGMATVYHAYDPRFKRDVALKVLPREFLHAPTFRVRFEREAQTIALLEHPAIVPVYDSGEEEGQPYLVMRYMTGGSLADRMARGLLSLWELAQIFERVGDALDEAHSHGIVHRDVTPRNILFDGKNTAYLSDFGIAKIVAASSVFTKGGIIGNPAYMSPEQARGERKLDGRSDVYSLGAVLFHALTDQPPYEAETPLGLALRHITDPVPTISAARPELSPAWQAIVARALAKYPADRYPTAGDLARAVHDTAAEQREVTAQVADASSQVPSPPPATPERSVIPALPQESHGSDVPPTWRPKSTQPTPWVYELRKGRSRRIPALIGIVGGLMAATLLAVSIGGALMQSGVTSPTEGNSTATVDTSTT